jgi:hypothetical protein
MWREEIAMDNKQLMYRWSDDEDWQEYKDGEPMEIEDYEIGKVYTVQYKVIEVNNE